MKWHAVICLYISLASFVLSGAESEVLPFYKGGDISMITRFEKEGLVLKEKGKPVDLFKVMMRHGCNTFRVRLFVNPNGKGGVIQNLAKTGKCCLRWGRFGRSRSLGTGPLGLKYEIRNAKFPIFNDLGVDLEQRP